MRAMAGDENGKKQQKTRAPNSRDARLAAALRENLRRRKAQERGRDAQGAETPPVDEKPDIGARPEPTSAQFPGDKW